MTHDIWLASGYFACVCGESFDGRYELDLHLWLEQWLETSDGKHWITEYSVYVSAADSDIPEIHFLYSRNKNDYEEHFAHMINGFFDHWHERN